MLIKIADINYCLEFTREAREGLVEITGRNIKCPWANFIKAY
jgi:hypothetical protein